ncbi:YeiH family protein [Humidisolicoccus flavus]|uniref:YeiH family protein n=1 Tax=Humidisolicoccus flavus TaxID=3111414 RepID=UPI003253CE53
MSSRIPWLFGVLVAALAAAIAFALHAGIPAIPVLTIAIVLGLIVGQIPPAIRVIEGPLRPGLAIAARRFLRIGIVLLGLKLSFEAIAALGWLTIALIIVLVVVSFLVTLWLGRAFKLPGKQPLMIASGFSICGVSAIGAVGGTVRAKSEDTATPIALVTLFGSLGIALLPLAGSLIGLAGAEYGVWVGASLHDVGQVVAAAQVGGTAALAVAVAIKLTRVLMLAPMVAVIGGVERRRTRADGEQSRPPIVPLFVAGFLAVVALNSFVSVPEIVVEIADLVQTALFAAALFAIGASIRIAKLARTGAKSALVGLISWFVICVLALGVVWAYTVTELQGL